MPNFTWTGKKFKFNGYRLPSVLDKVEAGEEGSISGRRLNIPIVPYLSFRYQSVFASQSKAPGADTASSIISNPTSRLSFFPGGAERRQFRYVGRAVPYAGRQPDAQWSLGLMSFDEFDFRFAKSFSNNVFGASFSNQNIKELYGFGPFQTLRQTLRAVA